MKKFLILASVLILLLSIASCGLLSSDDDPIIIEKPDISVASYRTQWKLATIPVDLPVNYSRAKILWHSPVEAREVREIYDRNENGTIRTFRMIFRPDTLNFGASSWAGITSKYDIPIPDSVTYFEFRAKGTGLVHFDFGLINEDINGNTNADTEDRDRSGDIDIEGLEDTGLDGLMDEDEPLYDPISNPDPNGDNWYSFFDDKEDRYGKCPLPNNGCDAISKYDYHNPLFYEFLNGTEGNIFDGGSTLVPDRESFYNVFNAENSYRTCEIDLTTSSLRIDSTERNGWYTYRIPLRNSTITKIITGSSGEYPLLENIKHIRVWFEADGSQTKHDTLEIAHWNFEPFSYNQNDDTLSTVVSYLRDYDYEERRVFDLALPSDNLKPTDRIAKFFLYESVSGYGADTIVTVANFYLNPNDTSLYKSEAIADNNTKVREISVHNYLIFHDRDVPYIVFNRPQPPDVHLGYYMEVLEENGARRIFGNLTDTLKYVDSLGDTSTVWHLKLLAPASNLANPTNATWQMMWRNCYATPKGMGLEDLRIQIHKGLEGNEESLASVTFQGTPPQTDDYLQILGLDLENSYSNVNVPDGVVDEHPHVYRSDLGLLIFPSRTPFNTDTTYSFSATNLPELEFKVPELYDYRSWTEKVEASQYFLRLEWQK